MPEHCGDHSLQGVHQGFESGDRKPLQLHPLALQLRGAGADLFLEPLVQLTVLEQHLAPLERPLHGAPQVGELDRLREVIQDRKSTRLNSSHSQISYAVFCLKKKNDDTQARATTT